MKNTSPNKLRILTISFILTASLSSFAQDVQTAEENQQNSNAQEALTKVQSLSKLAGLTGPAKEILAATEKILKDIQSTTRDNQEVIFDTVRQLENSLIVLENIESYKQFRIEVQATFSDLKKMATEKDLNSNQNLNRVVEKRIPRLLA